MKQITTYIAEKLKLSKNTKPTSLENVIETIAKNFLRSFEPILNIIEQDYTYSEAGDFSCYLKDDYSDDYKKARKKFDKFIEKFKDSFDAMYEVKLSKDIDDINEIVYGCTIEVNDFKVEVDISLYESNNGNQIVMSYNEYTDEFYLIWDSMLKKGTNEIYF